MTIGIATCFARHVRYHCSALHWLDDTPSMRLLAKADMQRYSGGSIDISRGQWLSRYSCPAEPHLANTSISSSRRVSRRHSTIPISLPYSIMSGEGPTSFLAVPLPPLG